MSPLKLWRRPRLPLPPQSMMEQIGAPDEASFRTIGEEFFGYFRDLCRLQPDEAVLEVGCGAGRMAFPLTQYLSRKGRYDAFDIYKDAIEWCQREITPRYPNFRFALADIHSVRYNPAGQQSGATFRFPYDDDSFDFVFLTSVFTHLLPDDYHHYLEEIARVLRPTGRCFATYFLLNDDSKACLRERTQPWTFIPDEGATHWVHSREVPEWAVAYEEEHVRAEHDRVGLPIADPVHYGAWCGRDDYLSAQDIVLSAPGRTR